MTSPAWERMRAAKSKKKRRKPAPVGPTYAKHGDWYESECGCLGKYRTGERGRLVWKPEKPCKAHVPPFDPSVVPAIKPVRRVREARPPQPLDTLWVLPCRICEAVNHDTHDLDCVFWVVSDHVPF